MNRISEEDRKRISEYRESLGKYEKPSVTADIVALRPAYNNPGEEKWRENPKFAIEVLLIRRGQWPYEGKWALPGGFIRPAESVEEGARRELHEETSLEAHPLIPVGVFSKPGRDMRAWIISNAFVSVYRRGEGCNVKGGDDAAAAKWFRVEFRTAGESSFELSFSDGAEETFNVVGRYRQDDFGGGTVTEVADNMLAFDHGEIIATAFLRMLSFDLRKVVFYFLPEEFTLSSYIDVYQYLTRNSVEAANIPNFRRQLTETKDPVLIPAGEKFEPGGKGHAKARLYRRR